MEELATKRKVSLTSMAIKMVTLSPDPAVLLYFENGKVKWTSFSKDGDYHKVKSDISADILGKIQTNKQYDASMFFDEMPDEATCWAESKYYNTYNFYLCIVKLDSADSEYD